MTIDEIVRGESKNVEFKVMLPGDSEKYTKTIVAFANTQGGQLIVGIDNETREVVGVGNDLVFKVMDSIANAVSDSCTPQIVPDITFQTINGKTLVVASVAPGANRPYYLKSKGKEKGTYVRVAGTSRLADEEKIRELEYEGGRISWDELICIGYEVTESAIKKLCHDINHYRKEMQERRDSAEKLPQVTRAQLVNWNVIKKSEDGYLASNAFALLTGKHFHYSRTQCAVFAGTERGEFIDKQEYSGPLYKQIEEAYAFVLRNIRRSAKVEGLVRREKHELPPAAIREMIINAHCHRNFLDSSCVQVALYDDRLEVTSPGGLCYGLTLEEAVSGRSKQRNRVIAEVFNQMGLIEAWGTGLRNIHKAAKEYHLPEPEFIEMAGTFRVNFYRKLSMLPEQHSIAENSVEYDNSNREGATGHKNYVGEMASEEWYGVSKKHQRDIGETWEKAANSVGIVGGGAAGMMAAITAAMQGAKVILLEGNDRLGKKLLSTGNGKCNLGNEDLGIVNYYTNQPKLLQNCLERFGTADTIKFFRRIGLVTKSKKGYLYPAGEQAAIVQDVLRCEVRELGVNVLTGCKIEKIWKKQNSNQIYLQGNGRTFQFDRVILACGSQAAPKTGSDGSGYRLAEQLGHTLISVVPALVQLKCKEDYLKAVAGVRAEAQLSVYWKEECMAQERGELQLTDYGISGIPVFQLSRIVNYLLAGQKYYAMGNGNAAGNNSCLKRKYTPMKEVEVEIDFFPDYTMEYLGRFLETRLCLQGQRTVEEFFTGILHKKLMLLFMKLAGLKPASPVAEADREKLKQVYRLCKKWKVHVTGSNSYENAQVCAGGVSLNEVTCELESKKVPGVYFAGELLDVDGKCGGYNLQWAWCSGYLTGSAAASRTCFHP